MNHHYVSVLNEKNISPSFHVHRSFHKCRNWPPADNFMFEPGKRAWAHIVAQEKKPFVKNELNTIAVNVSFHTHTDANGPKWTVKSKIFYILCFFISSLRYNTPIANCFQQWWDLCYEFDGHDIKKDGEKKQQPEKKPNKTEVKRNSFTFSCCVRCFNSRNQ